jgi:hypothetical protein
VLLLVRHALSCPYTTSDAAVLPCCDALQAIKRLMTALQRLCPTDPSRCVDFDVAGDEGRGIAGSGSNRNALLQAQVR